MSSAFLNMTKMKKKVDFIKKDFYLYIFFESKLSLSTWCLINENK